MSKEPTCQIRKNADDSVVAELIGASKIFKLGAAEIVALDRTDLKMNRGEVLLIIGPSGSGKTTLLSLFGCVLYPTQGHVCIKGVDTKELNERQLAHLRRTEIGFVFQNFNLIDPLNAEENIRAPLILNRLPKDLRKEKSEKALELVGLMDRRKSLPKQLSGGEQQRVAIARALVSDPAIVLCDEPTAALDADSMKVVLQKLRGLSDAGKAVAIVTHDPRLEGYADRIVYMEHGRIVSEKTGVSHDRP